MLVILDPLENEVLITGKLFDGSFDPGVPKLSLEDLISVIENPDVLIDPENDVDFLYYVKTLEVNLTVMISAYPLGEHFVASAFIINPTIKYLNELAKSSLMLNFTSPAKKGIVFHELSLQN